MCREISPLIQTLRGIGAGFILAWHAFATLYLVLILLGKRGGRFFLQWGPVHPDRRKWWQIGLWGGLLLVAGVLALGESYYTAAFTALAALGGGLSRWLVHSSS